MAWQDRVREAAYTTPSGNRLTFLYEDVSNVFDKKTSAFDFPDAKGTFIQDNGRTSRRLPLRIILSGDDYDLQAEEFVDGLSESGAGILEHPIYGKIDVVPFGSITRRDNLKTAANQAIIEVTFWETINIVYPSAQTSPASEVLLAVDEFNTAISEQFAESVDIDTAVEEASLKNQYEAVLGVAKTGLDAIADTQDDVRKAFNAVFDSINTSIDILIGRPATLAFQTTILLQTPARAITNITARLDAYNNLINSIIGTNGSIHIPSNDSQPVNAFLNDDVFVSTSAISMVVSVINNQFETKTEALEAADQILALTDTIINWRDDNYKSLGEIDTGSSYQQFIDAIALTAGFLVQISFNLKQERRLVLSGPRTIIDLVAELYGEIDPKLDFFINSNDLTGSEILELPAGKEVVYFV